MQESEEIVRAAAWGYTLQHCCTTFVDPTVLELLAPMFFDFFVGRIFEDLSNICPTKDVEQTWVLNAPAFSDQQMLYNNVSTCSPA